MVVFIAPLKTSKQYFAEQDYDRFTVSSADAARMNDSVLACTYLSKVDDMAFMLSIRPV